MTILTAGGALRASAWRPYEKNTLRGFFDLTLPWGLIIRGLTLHVRNDSRWVGMPGVKYSKADGTTGYTPVLEFVDRAAADEFRDVALAALDLELKA
jgi:hypothetical protein